MKNHERYHFGKWVLCGMAILVCLALSSITHAQAARGQMGGMMEMMTKSNLTLRLAMRNLWEDHVFYTRNYVISALANLEDKDTVANRLLRNQDDISNAVAPYYGDAAGKKLAGLLRNHIMIATEVVSAANTGNKEALDNANKRWYANADDIAGFLSGANPNWQRKDLTNMLYTHLDLLTGQVVSRIKKDWKSDIDYYDKGQAHILMLADTLTEGIVKQFPDKFTNEPPAAVR
jgi:hypothetical protein